MVNLNSQNWVCRSNQTVPKDGMNLYSLIGRLQNWRKVRTNRRWHRLSNFSFRKFAYQRFKSYINFELVEEPVTDNLVFQFATHTNVKWNRSVRRKKEINIKIWEAASLLQIFFISLIFDLLDYHWGFFFLSPSFFWVKKFKTSEIPRCGYAVSSCYKSNMPMRTFFDSPRLFVEWDQILQASYVFIYSGMVCGLRSAQPYFYGLKFTANLKRSCGKAEVDCATSTRCQCRSLRNRFQPSFTLLLL